MTALVMIWAVQATLIGTCALVLVRVGRRWSPRFRHGFVLVSLLSFLIPPVLSVPGVPTLLGSAARAGMRPVAPMLASGVHDGRPGELRSRLRRLGDSAARRATRLDGWQSLAVLGFAVLAVNSAAAQVSLRRAAVGPAGDTETTYVHLSGDDERPCSEPHAARHAARHGPRHH